MESQLSRINVFVLQISGYVLHFTKNGNGTIFALQWLIQWEVPMKEIGQGGVHISGTLLDPRNDWFETCFTIADIKISLF